MDIGAWSLLDTGTAPAERNMQLDADLLAAQASVTNGQATLHLYDWEGPSATYGYFIDPADLLDMGAVTKASLQIARRPTGGGVIFHITDYAFSIVVPASHDGYSVNILENYAFVNGIVIEVIKRFSGRETAASLLPIDPIPKDSDARHFCMAKPTKYDVMVDGRKVGGAAQRRTRHGFLHQGTISLAFPDEQLLAAVLKQDEVLQAMHAHTHVLLKGTPSHTDIVEARHTLKDIFKEVLMH